MFVSVILSTYASPEWLTKVICGYAAQTQRDFEVVVADDGSDANTAECIRYLRNLTKLSIQHIWQAKRGFGKCRILNQAIQAATADYLIFSDGDCIPRADFVAKHVGLAAPGCFLSGGVLRLPLPISRQIGFDEIASGRFANAAWLAAEGCSPSRKFLRLVLSGRTAAILDRMTPTRATFNGHNSSAWKADVLRVNGFDERLGYGGLDRELGERLVNAGVLPRQIRHRAVCLHLDHPRDYIDPAQVALNQSIRTQNRCDKVQWTPFGIWKCQSGLRRFSGNVVADCESPISASLAISR